jgi:hypothetical protein
LSNEEWAELSDELPIHQFAEELFAGGLTPQPIDHPPMDLRQG